MIGRQNTNIKLKMNYFLVDISQYYCSKCDKK